MIVDEVKIHIHAGNGGDGKVAFDTSKGGRGVTGGSGGRGGDVYVEGVSNLSALKQFRHKKDFAAGNGENGRAKTLDGANGVDLVLKVPTGTIVHNLDTKSDVEILRVGERVRVARGGRGGKGNFLFKGPRNTSPTQFEEGRPGELFEMLLELRLIADVGLIGLPNAGKSSLLNELTSAAARVADYPFTTLEPNLGVFYGKHGRLILADIPGLIEGASAGKGLGHKFLRHIERTKALLHCIAADNADIRGTYDTVRAELVAHSPGLAEKTEYICLTKTDLLGDKERAVKMKELRKMSKGALVVSIYNPEEIEELRKFLDAMIDEQNQVR
ncbi:MAG: GTPase ObgE [bacterium]|nr:GTPase ObgE [bacterium]